METFHHHLKASLRARLTGPNWTADLPWVLLGIRTAPKDDLGCSSAELVYGTPLAVPGEFFPNYTSRADSHSQFQQLRDCVRSYIPIPTTRHVSTPSSIPPNLKKTQFVFVRHDAHRSPLQRPYDGPYKVLQSGDKTFTLDIGGWKETISVDRLKPAHVDLDHLTTLPEPRHRKKPFKPSNNSPPSNQLLFPNHPLPSYTRSGHQVKMPQRYISVLGGVV